MPSIRLKQLQARSTRADLLLGLEAGGAQWPYWPVAAPFALCWLAFAWPWLSGAVTIPWDAKAQFAPQVQFLAASIARGESPFWTPYNFAGHPQIADPQSLIFSPPFFLLALFNAAPSLRALDATVLVSLLGGGLGVLWLTRELRWHWAGAVIAALGFCFGASMAWRLQHFGQVLSLAYWPFAYVLLKRGLERGSWVYGLGAGILAAFIILGRDQVGLLIIYILMAQVAWTIATDAAPRDALRRAVNPLLAGGVSGLAIIAIPLTLTLLLAAQSNRAIIDYPGAAAGSLHPGLIVTTIIPHLFGAAGEMEKYWGPPSFTWEGTGLFIAQNMGQLYLGAIPVLLLIAGMVRGILWDREIRFFTVVTIAVTVYALGGYSPAFRVLYEILPGVKLFRRPADATFLIGGFSSLLAGYVAHRFFSWTLPEARPKQRAAEIGIVAGAFVFAVTVALIFDRVGRATEPMLLAAGWMAVGAAALYFADTLKTLRPVAAALALIALAAVDITWNNGPNGASAIDPKAIDILEPDTRNQTLAFLRGKLAEPATPDRRDRVELIGLGFHWPNASLTHGIEQTLGYNPVRLKLYSLATGAGDSSGGWDQRKFTKLMPGYASPIADLLGLRYIVSGVPIEKIDPTVKPGDFKLLARTPDGDIYENQRALPRVMMVVESQRADFDQVLATGKLPAVDFRHTVLLELAEPNKLRRPGKAKITSYANTRVEIEADSPDGGWVVLNDVWHPWWTATVDGKSTPVMRANVLFRAVPIPPGHSRVVFTFQPIAGAWRELTGQRTSLVH
ncbi:MAG: hypothetical protein ABL904_05610 [Hyphomicrobiaceae bacterium]